MCVCVCVCNSETAELDDTVELRDNRLGNLDARQRKMVNTTQVSPASTLWPFSEVQSVAVMLLLPRLELHSRPNDRHGEISAQPWRPSG